MGLSAKAILFYGICYSDTLNLNQLYKEHGVDVDSPDFEEYPEFDTWYATKKGIIRNNFSSYTEFSNARNFVNDNSGCDVSYYCSSDYPMYFVYIIDTKYISYSGETTEISNLSVESDWNDLLKNYCDTLKLPYVEPKWLLVSLCS